jgi:hypothetical protein
MTSEFREALEFTLKMKELGVESFEYGSLRVTFRGEAFDWATVGDAPGAAIPAGLTEDQLEGYTEEAKLVLKNHLLKQREHDWYRSSE